MQVDSIKTCVDSAYVVCNQRLKLEYHELLSMFAFNFNLRRYTEAGGYSDDDFEDDLPLP